MKIKNFLYSQKVAPYVFVLPFLLSFAIFWVYPLVTSITMSFQDIGAVSSEWVGFKNYSKLLKDKVFHIAIWNSAKYMFFHDITGIAMLVHRKYKPGLLESAYEAALKYLLEQKGFKVERQKFLPIYWDDVKLDQDYRLDLVVNDNIILELKAVNFVDKSHRRQLFNYMHLTHTEYGMLINFGGDSLFSEWYRRSPMTGEIDKIKLL